MNDFHKIISEKILHMNASSKNEIFKRKKKEVLTKIRN